MRSLRRCASSGSVSVATSTPSNRYWPELGRSRQPSTAINVDFPEPDAPTIATNSPRAIVTLTPFIAWMSMSPTWYVRVRFRTSMSVSAMRFGHDDLVAFLDLPVHDLAHRVVVEAGGDGN